LIARVAGGVAAAMMAGHASAVCTPGTTQTISGTSSTAVTTACANESVVVSGTLDVPGGTAISNSDSLGNVTVSGTVRGQDPIYLAGSTMSGGLTNSGTIASYWSGGGSGFGNPAITLSNMQIAGTVFNTSTGSISGDYAGVRLEQGTTVSLLRNAGSITSLAAGVAVEGNGTTIGEIRNDSGATITGSNNGAIRAGNASVITQINNSGTLDGAAGIVLYNSASVATVVNSQTGVITGNNGIELSGDASIGDLENAGQITGSRALELYRASITGTLTNRATGVLSGSSAGISMGSYADPSSIRSIINEGLIEGAVGIDGHEGSVITHGINNTGTIRGNSIGISLVDNSAISGGLVNAGILEGTDKAIYIQSGSSLDRIDIVGTSAQVLGDVDASTTAFNVKTGSVFTATNAYSVDSFNVEEGATVNLTALTHTTSGLSDSGITVVSAFNNAGTVSIASGVTAPIRGDYAQTSAATLKVGVDSVATHGVLAVTGNATLAQGTSLNVAVGNGATFSPGARIQGVLTADGTLSVTTSGLAVSDNSVLYKFTADNTRLANQLDLLVGLDGTPFTSSLPSENRVARGVAATLDQVFASGSVPSGLQPVMDRLTQMSSSEATSAMQQLVPVLVGSASQAGVNALRSMNKIIQSRIESNQGLSSGDAAAERFAWVRAFGSAARQSNQGDVVGFDSRTSGLVVGADAPVNEKLRAGVAFTYAKSDIDGKSAQSPNSLDVDTYELVTYGSYNIDPTTDLNYQLDVGLNRVNGVRQIAFLGSQAKSSFDSVNVHGSVGVGRTWTSSTQTSWTPSVRADYTHMKTDGYTESGAAGASLRVGSSKFEELLVSGDLKMSHAFNAKTKVVANISAGYDFLNKQVATLSSFVGGGTIFETKGLKASPWLYRAGAALMREDRRGMEYSLRYDVETRSSGYLNQTLSARVRWAF
jgi:outer membrane autotransporter protein